MTRFHSPDEQIAELKKANARLRNRLAQAEQTPEIATTIWRVRWRRTGWKAGQRHVRYYAREAYARNSAAKLAAAPANESGRIEVELASCQASNWTPTRP